MQPVLAALDDRIAKRQAVVGVVGLGYVGLPLAVEAARADFPVIGFDIDPGIVETIGAGRSPLRDVPSDVLAPFVEAGRLQATTDLSRLGECDIIALCVPTPLNKLKDPDLSSVISAVESVAATLRQGQLVVLESTTYPGTTREVVQPRLEFNELRAGDDYFLCYSPERIDPANGVWDTRTTPRLLGGATERCLQAGSAFYRTIVDRVVPVSSLEVAELAKVYENTFRMVNIALANEVAQASSRLNVDVWEVIDAAATKPFGFMRFTPGPGLGGHCIPLDPHYLSWRMQGLDYRTRLIDLASEINAQMPAFVVQQIADALNDERRPLNGSRIVLLGVAYKPDVEDVRESPAIEITRLLVRKGAEVCYHDPYCPELAVSLGDGSCNWLTLFSVDFTADLLAEADAVVIVTDHRAVSYQLVADHARLVIDARGVMRGLRGRARIVGISGNPMTSKESLPRERKLLPS